MVCQRCASNSGTIASNINFDKIDFSTSSFWVQAHNLPLDRMIEHNAKKMGGFLVTFLHTSSKDTQFIKLSRFFMLRVSIDTHKPLKIGVFFSQEVIIFSYGFNSSLKDYRTFVISVGCLGHSEPQCILEKIDSHGVLVPRFAYDQWIGATNPLVRSQGNYSTPPTHAKDKENSMVTAFQSPIILGPQFGETSGTTPENPSSNIIIVKQPLKLS